jgi:hypothetical protein
MPPPRAAATGPRFSRGALLLSAAVVVSGEFPNPFRACTSSVSPAYGAPPISVYGGPPPPLLVDGGIPAPFASDASSDAPVGDAVTSRKDSGTPPR